VRDGHAYNEGDVQVGVRPYPISYRSIVPRAAECENLYVPVCLSATHIAYGSIRMEPVFMILGESSALAAALAIAENLPVQKVAYPKLKERLLQAGQILAWDASLPGQSGGNPGGPPVKLPGIVLDDTQAEKTGEWAPGSLDARVGAGYIHDNNAHKGAATVRWTFESQEDGDYEFNLYFPPSGNRATNAPVTVVIGTETREMRINQRTPAGVAKIGTFTLARGARATITLGNQGTDGHVIADGLQALKTAVRPGRPSGSN
jgi:hypothetical protein